MINMKTLRYSVSNQIKAQCDTVLLILILCRVYQLY